MLQEAQHRPLTAYGPSSLTYGGPDRSQQGLDPLMGPGQGNGMAPMGYVFLSAAIVTMLKEENLQAIFLHLSYLQPLLRSGLCYVCR